MVGFALVYARENSRENSFTTPTTISIVQNNTDRTMHVYSDTTKLLAATAVRLSTFIADYYRFSVGQIPELLVVGPSLPNTVLLLSMKSNM